MKVGILTYHFVPNYGAQLQTLSTIHYFLKRGDEPVVLHWFPEDLENMYSKRVSEEQMNCHKQFALNHFPLSNRCRTEFELLNEIERLNLDMIFLGSDALFKYQTEKDRKDIIRNGGKLMPCETFEGNPFFGTFIERLKKKIPVVVYAVSSQDCRFKQMTLSERRRFQHSMSLFSYVSVRDEWTRSMVRHIVPQFDAPVFPDPVFGFSSNVPEALIPSKDSILEKYGLTDNYVLVSFGKRYVTGEYLEELRRQLTMKGFQFVLFPMPEGLYDSTLSGIPLPLDPLDWYALIVHSKGYIGERMHPVVACLHNAVPFFCFDEYGTEISQYFTRKRFWIPKKIKDYKTSKSFNIVFDAGLTENWMSYFKGEFPSAADVVRKLTSFDKEKCLLFSKRKEKEYLEGMAVTIGNVR